MPSWGRRVGATPTPSRSKLPAMITKTLLRLLWCRSISPPPQSKEPPKSIGAAWKGTNTIRTRESSCTRSKSSVPAQLPTSPRNKQAPDSVRFAFQALSTRILVLHYQQATKLLSQHFILIRTQKGSLG